MGCFRKAHNILILACCVLSSVDGIVGEMHLDMQKVNRDFQRPLRINIDSGTDVVSGYFFNFHDHKPTFKVDSKDQPRVSLTGGPLNSTYLMDQFHFHVYCTREESEQNTLDRAQVPGEVSESVSSFALGNLRWLTTFSGTFPQFYFGFMTKWCYNTGITQMPKQCWTRGSEPL